MPKESNRVCVVNKCFFIFLSFFCFFYILSSFFFFYFLSETGDIVYKERLQPKSDKRKINKPKRFDL
jgi:hypothetical protein